MWRPALDDYVRAASVVLDIDEAQLRRLPNLGLAESALAAPFAGVGGEDAYPTLEAKAAVLLERLVRNHPLPDGNKRAALLLTMRFLEVNGLTWGAPDVERDAGMVERIAAGDATLDEVGAWIAARIS